MSKPRTTLNPPPSKASHSWDGDDWPPVLRRGYLPDYQERVKVRHITRRGRGRIAELRTP